MSCSAWFDGAQTPKDKPKGPPVLAICVGHSRYNDLGAVACDDETPEWAYNLKVAKAFEEALSVPSVVIAEYTGSGYSEAMSNLCETLSQLGVDAALELHFNAASPSAHGTEMLYWRNSASSKELAQCLQDSVLHTFNTRDRGIKAKSTGDRGAKFLRETPCPAVIVEPFFGSNEEDWENFKDRHDELGQALAEGFTKYHEKKRS